MYVVAAASGRTGRVVTERLLAHGREVRVLVRSRAAGERWRRRGADVVELALDDAAALARALADATGFYTILPEDLAEPDFTAHRQAMIDAIAAAVIASRVPHVVFLSAAAAVLSDGNGPAADLHRAEQALRAAAVRLTTIRASYFQENVLGALGPARGMGVYPSFFPSAQVAFPTNATVDVGTLAAQCLLEPPVASEIVDLVGPVYTVRELADHLGAAIGVALRIVDVPVDRQVGTLVDAGMPVRFAEALVEMFACFASGRISPRGDRMVAVTTTLADILPGLLVRPEGRER